MKKPLAKLLVTSLLLLLFILQVSALQLPMPGQQPPIDLPPINLPPIDPPTVTFEPIDPFKPLDPGVIPVDPPDITPIDPGPKPMDPGVIPVDPPIVIPIEPPPPLEPIDPGPKPMDPGVIPIDPPIIIPIEPPPPLEPIDPGPKPMDPGVIPLPIPKIPVLPGDVPTPGTPGKTEVAIPEAGEFVTSEGPLFLMYRGDLTKGYEMFTPLDLTVDGEYYFPLISNAMHKVGEIKVSVKSGIVIATPLVPSGVTLSKDFMTFFPDIAGVTTIDPAKLANGNIPFGLPVDVGSRFSTDPKVLLYVNCAVKYKTNLPGVSPFSLESPEYLERMYALITLMD